MVGVRRFRRYLPVGAALVVCAAGLLVLGAVTGAMAAWAAAALVLAGVLAGAAVLLHRPATGPTGTSAAAPSPAVPREVDDLPGFFDSPPGSPPALPAAGPRPATTSPGRPVQDGPPTRSSRDAVVALAAGAVVLVGVAGTVLAASGRDGSGGRPAATGPATPPTTTSAPAPLTAAAAGDLADTDLDPGADGVTGRLTFGGVVLEPRAVGTTVTYPIVRISSDGDRSIAHVELPTWNCLAAEPPADPAAAGCTPTPTEYADLAGPDLRLSPTADGLSLTGTFATYTRPDGGPAVYTGRSYPVTVDVTTTPDGVEGTVRLADGEAGTAGGPTANELTG